MNLKKLLPSWLFSKVGILLALFVGLLLFVFFKGIDLSALNSNWKKVPSGVDVLKRVFTATPAGTAPSTDLKADVSRADFGRYREYLGIQESISITIVDTTIEFEISARAGTEPGVGEFVVTPQQYQFATTDIEAKVAGGLETVPSGKDSAHLPRWSGWSIATNKAERAWTIQMRGLAGEGKVRLTIGAASAFLDVHLPRLLPIWKFVRFVDPRSGIVVIGGHDVRVGEVIAPDLAHDLCGFRVHSISNRSVWFEIVNSEPNPALLRTRWPDVRIDWQELDNGQSRSMLVFESGHKMAVGDMAIFDEQGDALKLDADAFLSERAVRLRYLDQHDVLVADMIVVTFTH